MKSIVKKIVIALASVYSPITYMSAEIIFTYTNPEAAIFNKADFSLTSNTIDNILTSDRSDFVKKGAYANPKSEPLASPAADVQQPPYPKAPSIQDSYAYANYYKNKMQQSTDKNDFVSDTFNLYSGGSFQLSYLPSDFNVISDVFKSDPQLDRLSRYLINDQTEIFPGQRIVVNGQSATFTIGRQSATGYRQPINNTSSYSINCPAGLTQFDISELAYLPTNIISTQTKGCSVVYLGSSAF